MNLYIIRHAADALRHFDHRTALKWLLTPGILMEIGDK